MIHLPGHSRPLPRSVRWCLIVAVLLGLNVGRGAQVQADDPRPANPDATAAELLADSTVLYAELADPPRLVQRVLTHPLASKVQASDTVRGIYESPEVAKMRLGVGFVELGLGMTWQSLVDNLTTGGIYLAVDRGTRQPIIMVKAKDAESLERLRDRVLKLARDDARGKGQPDPIQTGEHRGLRGYKIDRFSFVTLGPWLVASEKSEALKPVADAWLDGQTASLAKIPEFQTARAARPTTAFAWAFVRLDKLRDAGLAPPLVKGTTDNPVAELLLGGIMANLQKTSHVSASWTLEDDRTRLLVSAPHDDEWVPQSRKFFFGPAGQGAAPAMLAVPGQLSVLRVWRDIGGMWAAAPDLFDERVNGELAQANSNLSNVLGGKDFGQDVLESLGAEIQVVAARAQFEKDAPTPAIKLPAFGVVVRLRDADTNKRLWKVMFQTLIGFVNIGGGMQGLPLLELETEKLDDAQLIMGRYVPPEKISDETVVGMHYNFSPTMIVVGDRLLLASNRQLAVELLKAVRSPAPDAPANTATPTGEVVNTELSVDGPTLRAILDDNRRQLVAQNMLEKGHDRAAAEAEIGALMSIAEFFRGVGLRVTTLDKTLRVSAEVRLATEPAK